MTDNIMMDLITTRTPSYLIISGLYDIYSGENSNRNFIRTGHFIIPDVKILSQYK